MNRDQFFDKLATLDEERLKKSLWNLYWRGSAQIRERIEAELDPEVRMRARAVAEQVDPALVLEEVRDFVSLTRSGAYMAGDRRVSPKERTKWRTTFRRHVTESQAALKLDVDEGASAMEALIDLAPEMRDKWLFRSEDPVSAARFVVSDQAHLLWSQIRETQGFAAFVEAAAPQLMRWESRHGWTRFGDGPVAEKETSLAAVLSEMLGNRDPDFRRMWAHVEPENGG